MLIKNNWGDVWHNIPLNPIYISPSYMRYIRNFLKVFLYSGKEKVGIILIKNLFPTLQKLCLITVILIILKIINNSRIARNAISWHVEEYLRLKGIE